MSLPNNDINTELQEQIPQQEELKENKKTNKLAVLYDRRWKRVLLIIIAILLVIVLAAVSTFGIMYSMGKKAMTDMGNASFTAPSNVEVEIDEDGVVRYKGEKYVYNEDMASVLILGIDSGEKYLDSKNQADAIYLAAIDTKSGKTTIIAVSRDIMADVNVYSDAGASVGVKRQQICTSFAYGKDSVAGCENTVLSVSRLLYGIPINTYFSMEWDAIKVLTDYVGGVTVPGYDSDWNPTGKMVTVNGQRALDYIQKRSKTTLEGNNNRMQRQIDYLKAFAAKAIEKTKQDITTPVNLYNRLNKYSTNNLDASRITYLATVFMNGGAQLEFLSVPGTLQQGEKYAEMYVDEEALYEIVLDVFYKKQ